MPASTPNPAKTAQNSTNGANGYVPAKYVKCELTSAQRILLKTFRDEVELIDLVKWQDDMIVEGHVVSLKLEQATKDSATYLYNCTGVKTFQNKHDGICLNARGSTPTNAWIACYYKDREVLHGDWSVTEVLREVDL